MEKLGFVGQGLMGKPMAANLAKAGFPLTLYNRTRSKAEDLVKAYDTFARSRVKHAVYNIGGGSSKTISLLEFFDLLKKLTGKRPKISFSRWRPSDQKVYISDIAKIRKELSWKPKVTVKEGVSRIVEWAQKNRQIF